MTRMQLVHSLGLLPRLGSAGILFALASCGGPDGGGSAGGPPPPPAGCVSTATAVCTQYGQLQGAVAGGYRYFRGIPFTAPPVGGLRWRPPAAPAKWQGVRDATQFGNICPQSDGNGGTIGEEDCLTLNVYAVNPPASSKQPVIVIIHGGGNRAGSAQAAPWNDVTPLAGHGAIVVTVQYRLGLLGWLVSPLLTAESPQATSGNYTLMDLIAALQWVHDNIAEFGGDPARVMIVGHSAGSLNVEALLASPAAAGLFSAAVMESGLLRGGLIGTNIDVAYHWYADVPSAVGCDTAADVLACLRAVPASTLVQSGPNSADTGWVNVDPVVLPEDPGTRLKRLGSPVPLIIGSNGDEEAYDNTVFAPALDASGYAAAIHTQFDALAPGAGDTILSLYPATDFTSPNYALDNVETDYWVTRDTRNFARYVSGAQRAPVWRYLFKHVYENAAPQDAPLMQARAFHGAETFFVTGNFQSLATSVTYVPTSAELALSNAMMDYWVALATSGDPNGSGAAAWLPYDAASENVQLLDDNITTLAGGYRNAQCDFMTTLITRGF
jgi:para-nitrobenzyl esterase